MEGSLRGKHWDLTQKIIECAMNVHNSIGSGFLEQIYQNAMAVEMSFYGMKHEEEIDIPIFHRSVQVGTRRADSIVENLIMLEYKARTELGDQELAQGINYLEASKFEIGLLINFGNKKLQFKRLFNNKHPSRIS
jgi:GxxExxY protein